MANSPPQLRGARSPSFVVGIQPMSDSPEELRRRIAELEAQLHTLKAAHASSPAIDSPHAERDVNIATQQTVTNTQGAVDNSGRIDGVAVGVNLGTIVYGRAPEEDE